MERNLTFELKRPAKSSGGDRYEHGNKGDEEHMVIYVPQHISRSTNHVPVQTIEVKLVC